MPDNLRCPHCESGPVEKRITHARHCAFAAVFDDYTVDKRSNRLPMVSIIDYICGSCGQSWKSMTDLLGAVERASSIH